MNRTEERDQYDTVPILPLGYRPAVESEVWKHGYWKSYLWVVRSSPTSPRLTPRIRLTACQALYILELLFLDYLTRHHCQSSPVEPPNPKVSDIIFQAGSQCPHGVRVHVSPAKCNAGASRQLPVLIRGRPPTTWTPLPRRGPADKPSR